MIHFTRKASAVICCAILLVMAGAIYVSADTESESTGAEQTGKPEESSGRLLISEPGTYTLTGSMKGTVLVDPGKGDVTLILDNADIEGVEGPAVMAVSGDSLTIEMTECSYNRLADKKENAEEAVILSRINTVFRGCGCLQVEGNRRYGIQTEEADLTFECGKYLLLSAEAGIIMGGLETGTLYLNGGCVFINAKQDPHIVAEHMEMKAGMLEKTEKTDVRTIQCCREGKCLGCCCEKKCRRAAVVQADDDDDDECDCRESDVDHPGPIKEGTVTNAAVTLEEDEQPVTIMFEEETQHVGISEPGTYYITGTSANGSITVKENTKGVVLVLNNLDLTNASGTALKIGNASIVKIRIEGNVTLSNAAVTEAADTAVSGSGAMDTASAADNVVQGGDGSEICITGDGTLKINGETGDGIAMGESSSLVIDGAVDIQIQAERSGIYSEHDLAILQGNVTTEAGASGVQAEHVLTIGEQGEQGPEMKITGSYEGISAEVVNIKSGSVDMDVKEDGIDAKSAESGTDASVNMTGGEIHIHSKESGIDSDGNINLIGGTAVIDSKGEDGTCNCVDADGDLYIADEFSLDCGCDKAS